MGEGEEPGWMLRGRRGEDVRRSSKREEGGVSVMGEHGSPRRRDEEGGKREEQGQSIIRGLWGACDRFL